MDITIDLLWCIVAWLCFRTGLDILGWGILALEWIGIIAYILTGGKRRE